MKKILSLFIVFIMMFSLVACGSNADNPIINDEINTESGQDNVTDNTSDKEDEIYNNKVYYVGDDIPVGTYAINCTSSEYGMDVVVFKSKAEYESFQNAEKFTNGEYRNAIEQNAWMSLYVKENEFVYVGLKAGNIILLDGGMCEFSKYSALESDTLYSGIYVVGEDVPAGSLDIIGTTDYLKVVVFDSVEKYSTYHKTDRFTVGEESDAIEANSSSIDYIYGDDSTSVKLENGMVLMVDNGIGKYSLDDGPVIN